MTLNTRQEAGGDRRDQLWGSLVAFLVINNIVVASRIYVHARTQYNARKRLYLEDIFALLSAVSHSPWDSLAEELADHLKALRQCCHWVSFGLYI